MAGMTAMPDHAGMANHTNMTASNNMALASMPDMDDNASMDNNTDMADNSDVANSTDTTDTPDVANITDSANVTDTSNTEVVVAPVKKSRQNLSIAEKFEVLERFDALPYMTLQRAAEELGVSQHLLSKILKNRSVLNSTPFSSLSQRRKRCGKAKEVEDALKEYYVESCRQGIVPTGPVLRRKAEDLAKDFGKEDFKATEGWFNRWKKREGLVSEKYADGAKILENAFLQVQMQQHNGDDGHYQNQDFAQPQLSLDEDAYVTSNSCDSAPLATAEEDASTPPFKKLRHLDGHSSGELSARSAHPRNWETEFDVFGRSVAAQLNSMPWEQAIELQTHIQSMITDYRLKLHRQSS